MTLQPQSQPQPQPRRLSTCNLHPDEPVTGICAPCLRERLTGFDPSLRREISSTTAAAAASDGFKSIFNNSGGGGADISKSKASSSSSFLPDLRRSKSFSGNKCDALSGLSEPRRKSCDVRVRNTLWFLFNLDDERNGPNREVEVEVETRSLGFQGITGPVFESREEDEDEEEIRASEDVLVPNVNVNDQRVENIEEKTMKEYIDLEWKSKKSTGRDLKDFAGSFWVAAAVFSEKLRKWRQKQKMKKCRGGGGGDLLAMQVEKPIGRQLRETQSEIADYGFGRRSCDTDPRFSVDAGRMSLDDVRYSFDEPRASWDGYLIGRTLPRLMPKVSVIEDVRGSDNRVTVEEHLNSINKDNVAIHGESAHYSDSSSSHRRRRSFDRSSSDMKTAVLEVDDMKSISNAKVSPASIEFFHGTKLLITKRDLRDSNLNSLQDDCLERFESVSKDTTSIASGGNRKGFKKSRRWRKAWNIWGLIHRRNDNKYDDKEKYFRGNVVDRPLSKSWEKLGREANGEVKGASSGKLIRSNSSVSSRSSYVMAGSFRSMSSSAETRGHGKKRREEFVLERNRSARYSPNNLDNGLLRFYLTPLRSSRRSKSGKSRLKNSHSISKSDLRLY